MLKKVDRVLSNIAWRHMLLEAFTETLPHLHSDHAPFLMRCAGKVLEKGVCPFRFLAAWITHTNYDTVVDNAWKLGSCNVSDCLSSVMQESIIFNTEQFGNFFFHRKQKLEARLRGIQRKLELVESQEF